MLIAVQNGSLDTNTILSFEKKMVFETNSTRRHFFTYATVRKLSKFYHMLVVVWHSVKINEFFSITQILREIKVGEYRISEYAILTHLDDLNFAFYEFLHFLKAEIYLINETQSLQYGKNGSFRTSKFFKIDFT